MEKKNEKTYRKRTLWFAVRRLMVCGLLVLAGAAVLGRGIGVARAEDAVTDSVEELFGALDYSELDAILTEEIGSGQNISFGGYVFDFITGEREFSLRTVGEMAAEFVLYGLDENLAVFSRLFLIVALAAFFSVFASSFRNAQIAETGFYVSYLLLFFLLSSCFLSAAQIAADALLHIVDFMKVLVPVYLTGLVFSTGAATSSAFYSVYLLVVTLSQDIVSRMLLPLVNIHVLLNLTAHLPLENHLSKLSEFVKNTIRFGKKAILWLATGFSVIQGILAPGIDRLKQTTLTKAVGAIPVLGGLFSGVTETVLGAGILLKNAIGVVGMLFLVFLCARPLIRLALYAVLFQFAAAVAQPVADKRAADCISEVGKAIGMLLEIVFACLASFLIALVVMSAGSS